MFPATQHYAAVGDTCNQNKCFDPFPGKAEMEIRSYLKLESCLLTEAYMILLFLFSNFRRVLNVICFFFLGNSLASEFRHQEITQKKAYNMTLLIQFLKIR